MGIPITTPGFNPKTRSVQLQIPRREKHARDHPRHTFAESRCPTRRRRQRIAPRPWEMPICPSCKPLPDRRASTRLDFAHRVPSSGTAKCGFEPYIDPTTQAGPTSSSARTSDWLATRDQPGNPTPKRVAIYSVSSDSVRRRRVPRTRRAIGPGPPSFYPARPFERLKAANAGTSTWRRPIGTFSPTDAMFRRPPISKQLPPSTASEQASAVTKKGTAAFVSYQNF